MTTPPAPPDTPDDPLDHRQPGRPRGAEGQASPWPGSGVDHLGDHRGILLPLAGVTIWTRNQLLDTDRYVATVAPLATDPAIQDAAVSRLTTTVSDAVDFKQVAMDALPEKAQVLAGPIAVRGRSGRGAVGGQDRPLVPVPDGVGQGQPGGPPDRGRRVDGRGHAVGRDQERRGGPEARPAGREGPGWPGQGDGPGPGLQGAGRAAERRVRAGAVRRPRQDPERGEAV